MAGRKVEGEGMKELLPMAINRIRMLLEDADGSYFDDQSIAAYLQIHGGNIDDAAEHLRWTLGHYLPA